ncbi:multidrug effflux MFS transporter [Oryzifoliimicrobium ureilyticus]|uniref:multidrug effflux MFS transporter n=1 Tax=Oryzifoliimicrobium ureilyticus TaxID=3113724 RepID=UPI003075F8A7
MTLQHKPHVENQGARLIGMGFGEFVITIAIMTASVAMAIDSMVPALPAIGHALGVQNPNDGQWVIGVFFLGFGVSQIVFGSLADAFGRRRVLLAGMAVYALAMFAAAATTSFSMLLIMRFVQGIGGAAVRITTMALVRDCFGGREMARVMSYVMIVFMIVPIIAPSVGQFVISYANWHWIFLILGIVGAILFLWALARLKESLTKEERLPLSFGSVRDGFKTVLTNRTTCGYMIGLTMFIGVISAYVVSVQQVFGELYQLGEKLPLAFAATAGGIAVANFANGFFVRSFGMRRISHAAMILFTIMAAVGLIISLGRQPNFAFAFVLFSLMLMMFAMITTNFTAISLEPMGNLAGTATAITGFVSTTGGAVIGGAIGQMFNGTTQPLFGGFLVCGLVTIIFVLWAERGRLFTHPADDPQLDPGSAHI